MSEAREVAFWVGRIPVRNRVLAAPMCGSSKVPYRQMATRFGADLVFTEMVKARPLVEGSRKTLELLVSGPSESNLGPQICGADEGLMARAALALEELGFPLVDINMGCPVKKIVREGAGSALLTDPRRVEAMVRACARAVSVPVTVKIRSGWDADGRATADELARAAEAGGARLLTIHGRARSKRHEGEVDEDALGRAKAAVSIPVVANGGVTTGEGAARLLAATGCDAVMIGRGAHGRPWLFRDAARALAGLAPLGPPDPVERCGLAREHLDGMVGLMGAHGVLAFRKMAGWYLDDPREAALLDRAYRTSDPDAMRALLAECAARRAAGSGENERAALALR